MRLVEHWTTERIAAREEEFLDGRFGRRAPGREFYAISEVAVAFFFLDIVEDYVAHGHGELDPVWTTVGLIGALLFGDMWTRKKLGRLPR